MLFADSFVHGGTERQLVSVLQHLDRSRYDAWVGCLKRRGPFLDDVEALGIPVVEFPMPSLHSVKTLSCFRRLVSFLRAESIDVLHAFEFYSNCFAVPAGRVARVPVVLASRRELGLDRSAPRRLAIRLACQLAHGVVANSESAGRLLTGLVPATSSKVTIVRNGIDLRKFQPRRSRDEIRAELGADDNVVLVGLLAALRPEKRVETFLRAAAVAASAEPNLRIVVIGDGVQRSELENLVDQLELRNRAQFLGDRRDVADLLSGLDIFVLSSLTESFPNAVLEAMASGLPVVATRVGGIPELVDEGTTGLLSTEGNHDEMADLIRQLARGRDLRRQMGAAGRERVEQEFTAQTNVKHLENLYERLIRERRPMAKHAADSSNGTKP